MRAGPFTTYLDALIAQEAIHQVGRYNGDPIPTKINSTKKGWVLYFYPTSNIITYAVAQPLNPVAQPQWLNQQAEELG